MFQIIQYGGRVFQAVHQEQVHHHDPVHALDYSSIYTEPSVPFPGEGVFLLHHRVLHPAPKLGAGDEVEVAVGKERGRGYSQHS